MRWNLNSMATLNLNKGEHRELVFVNETSLDLHCYQAENSSLRLFVINFTSAQNVLHIDHQANGCNTEIYHLALLRGKDSVIMHTRMHHEIGKGTSRQVVKFVLDDEAQGTFRGELRIHKDAQQVDAQQNNRNLLLSSKATMRTQPQLEIYADDVKASHGASTGQLDESALFYMQQRGISAEQGRKMLLRAFVADIIEQISDENQRNELMRTIDSIFE